MSNYIWTSWMYDTGFIPAKATGVREKQGLDSQLISSACANTVDYAEKYVPYIGGECASHVARAKRYNYQDNLVNADMQNLYPVTMPNVNYRLPPLPASCQCLQFLHEYTSE